jgi:capsular polysaccharide biosynthesis protein
VTPDLGRYAATLRRHWQLALAIVGVSASMACGVAALSTASYSATAKVLLDQDRHVDALLGTNGYSPDPERELNTAVLLITQQPIAEQVRDSLRLPAPASVSAAADSSSSIVAITATDADPVRAARIANAFATAYRRYRSETTERAVDDALSAARARRSSLADGDARDELNAEIRRLQTLAAFRSSGVQLVQHAAAEDAARRPRPALAGFVGGFLGAVLAAVAIVVLTRTDRRVREVRDVELAAGRPAISPTALALSMRGPVVLLMGEGAAEAAHGVARALAAGDRSGIVIEAGDDPSPISLRVETACAEAEIVLLAGEGIELAALADEVVLVARLGVTTTDRLSRAVRELGVVGMPPTAVVAVDRVPAHREPPVARRQEVAVG